MMLTPIHRRAATTAGPPHPRPLPGGEGGAGPACRLPSPCRAATATPIHSATPTPPLASRPRLRVPRRRLAPELLAQVLRGRVAQHRHDHALPQLAGDPHGRGHVRPAADADEVALLPGQS